MLIDADHSSIGPLFHWSIGPLVHWTTGPLVECQMSNVICYKSNIKCQMSIKVILKLKFCRSVPPELLRSFFGFVSDSFFSKLNQNIDKKFDVDAVQNIFVRYSLACTLRHLHLHIRKPSGQKIRLNSETPLC